MKLAKYSGKQKKLKKLFLVRKIVGHSMLPVLPPGTIVICVGYYRQLKPGDVVVVEHHGKEKIKRIDQTEDNKIFVLGDHANASTDSRHFGWLQSDEVVAKVIWPRAKKQ